MFAAKSFNSNKTVDPGYPPKIREHWLIIEEELQTQTSDIFSAVAISDAASLMCSTALNFTKTEKNRETTSQAIDTSSMIGFLGMQMCSHTENSPVIYIEWLFSTPIVKVTWEQPPLCFYAATQLEHVFKCKKHEVVLSENLEFCLKPLKESMYAS